MPSGLAALLDDVAVIARLATASVDDIAAAAGRAGMKTAGVVIDDAAVTPTYVVGLSPARELPIIWKITLGSLRNKLVYLLPAALLLSHFAPWLITPLLMLGGSYLAFEASEKIFEFAFGKHEEQAVSLIGLSPEALEERQVAGAIRTDFILSAEIMAITLAGLDIAGWWQQIAALTVVAVVVTLAVYGLVALIIKLDDIGLHLVGREAPVAQKLGSGLIAFVPRLLKALSVIGTAAMLWVGGGIVLHGLEVMNIIASVPQGLHHFAASFSMGQAWLAWLLNALGASFAGLLVGFLIIHTMVPVSLLCQKFRKSS